MLEEMGVETAYIENVPEGPDAERVIRDFAEKGYDLIITTSFGYMNPTITVAEEYPETWFVHISGYKTADNVSTVFGRMYQPRFLSGLVAGKATQTNKIGYVAAFPIPEVIRGINAFTLSVRAANPEATVNVVWTNPWFGPPEEKEAAEALLDQGADVIARESDSTEADKLAEEKGIHVIGYNADVARDQSPDAFLTAPIWHWDVFYKKVIQDVAKGAWTNAPVWWGMAEGILSLAPIADFVPQDVKHLVQAEQTRILSGEFDVFEGPINDNAGELRVPDGETMSDEDKLSFDWLVEGVVGEIPQ